MRQSIAEVGGKMVNFLDPMSGGVSIIVIQRGSQSLKICVTSIMNTPGGLLHLTRAFAALN